MIEFRSICKSFFGNMVLKDINFQAHSGEILALAGQNGAGKSTLIKILSGIYHADSGEVLINGKVVNFHNTAEADESGIGIVYQELSGVPHLSVSDNVVLGKDLHNRLHFLTLKKQHEAVHKIFERLGVEIDINRKLGSYPASTQQIVEIAKCMYKGPKVVVFDEPTTSLTSVEREKLFNVMNKMREDGLTIIFITHYLEEIVSMADKCVVLKDGGITYFGSMEGMDTAKIVSYMIGQNMDDYYPELVNHSSKKVALELKGFGGGFVSPCDIKVHYGEVVGLAGLIGSGRTELMHMLIGAARHENGDVYIDGKKASISGPSSALKQGIAYINEDRRVGGLNLTMPIDFNISLPSIAKGKETVVNKGRFIKTDSEKQLTGEMIDKLEIKCVSPKQRTITLSGGNQQKIAIAKWIAADTKIYIFDEPTKGIDVLTKSRIYNIIRELSAQGAAIIVISSYCPELIGACDRIEVMSKGKLVASFGAGVEEYEILLAQ